MISIYKHFRFLVHALGSLITSASLLSAATYYVAPVGSGGSNANPGTLVSPFLTIQKAASVAVAGDTVLVRAGTYRETVTPANSGTAGNPITFQNYNSETVIINGADLVTGWTLDSGNVYKAPLANTFFVSNHNQSDQIFVDGVMVTLARWPNTDHTKVSYPAKSSITAFVSKTRNTSTNWTTGVFEDANCNYTSVGQYLAGAQITLQPNFQAWSWTLSGTITAVSALSGGGTQITFQSRNDSGQDGNSAVYPVGSSYYVINKKALLDSAAEWFHDTSAGQLYLWTPDGTSPASHTIEAKKRDYAFNLSDRAYIVVKGFNLFASTITTDSASGSGVEYDGSGVDQNPWRGGNSYAAANHITIDGINAKYVFHYIDQSGHFFLQYGCNSGMVVSGSDHVIQNCTIQYSAGNGISLFGYRNKALNNTVLDTSYNQQDMAAIATTPGAGTSFDEEIGGNTIIRTGRSGITIRNLKNSTSGSGVARIHDNNVSYFMIQDYDGGGIYTYNVGMGFVRIDHNKFHHGYNDASGVYLDYSSEYIVDHNVMWSQQNGIHLQRSDNVMCYNNTILSHYIGNAPLGPSAVCGTWSGTTGILMRNNLYISQKPPLAGGDDPFYCGTTTLGEDHNLTWDGQYGSSTDPKFADFGGDDYRLTSSSAAYHAGVIITDQVYDSVVVTAYNDVNDGTPNIGAYEGVASAASSPGANLARVGGVVVTASSSTESTGFGKALVIDGVINSTAASRGFRSSANTGTQHTEWLQFDLGSSKQLNRLDVYPRNDGPTVPYGWDTGNIGFGFPQALTIRISDDSTFTTGVTIVASNDCLGELYGVVSFRFSPVTGRYVRITADRLIWDTRNNAAANYFLQLGEVEIYNNIADITIPAAPIGLEAVAISSNQIALSWTDTSTNETAFKIERSLDGSTGWAQITVATAGSASYTDTGLSALTTYYYRIRATNSAGDSSYTSNAAATTPVIITTVADPTFSPGAGTYAGTQSVTINTTTSGASIRYTTDGSAPTGTTGTLYTGAFNVTSTTTIRAIAYKAGLSDSAVSNVVLTITTVSLGGTAFSSTPYDAVAYAANNAFDGDTNSCFAGLTSTNNWVGIDVGAGNATAIAIVRFFPRISFNSRMVGGVFQGSNDGVNYTQIAAVAGTPADGAWSTVSVSDTSPYRYLRYYNANYADIAELQFIPSTSSAVSAPVFSPSAGSYLGAQSVTLSTTTPGATIRYTTDGSAPTSTTGTVYSGAINVSATTTLKAIAYKSGYSDSSVVSATYTINPLPVAPSTLTATAVSATRVNLTWTDNAGNETGFKLERSLDGSTGWTQIFTPSANATSASDTGLATGTSYYYRLCATNASGDSSYTSTASATPAFTTARLGYYHFDEISGLTAADSSGNGRNATLSGSAGFAPISGKIGGALTLTGAIGIASFSTVSTSVVGVSAWFNASSTGGGTFGRILDAPGYRLYIAPDSSGGGYHIRFQTVRSTTNGSFDTPNASVSLGTWTHVAASYDSSSLGNLPTIYLNGTPVTVTTFTAPAGTQVDNAGTGYWGNNAALARNWDGMIDETTLYASLLSDAQAAWLSGTPPSAPSNLVAAAASSTQINLTWTDNSSNESGFKLERSLDGTTGWTQIASLAANATSASDTGPTAGTTYYYRLRATNAYGDSQHTGTAFATTLSLWQSWLSANGLPADGSGIGAGSADPDGDGLPNLLEYAFGGSPVIPDATVQPVVAVSGANQLRIAFSCDATKTGITYNVQASSDLVAWTDIASSIGGAATTAVNSSGATIADAGSGVRTVTVTDPTTLAVSTKRFLRLKITRP